MPAPHLLDQIRSALRVRHVNLRTEETCRYELNAMYCFAAIIMCKGDSGKKNTLPFTE
jgi:hypothetical protein